MINWRSIKEIGLPTKDDQKYLVTDGKDISTSTCDILKNYNTGESRFLNWEGDDNTHEENSCCYGTKVFIMNVTHWCPISELNLPLAKREI